ncbi:MAG: conjugal transfer protein [Mycobacteriaceae bacterium]|nr:conjugal transfer protein [Mycobacteriaceae bacterium]
MVTSKTWQARLHRWRQRTRTLGRAAVIVAAAVGAAAGGKVFLAPDHPDIESIAQRVGNQQAQIGSFAADFVVSWLTATAGQRADLQRFITLADTVLTLPTTPAAVVTAPHVVSVIRTATTGDADVYSATVSVTERAYASASATRAFYRVPVSMWEYQPRALALPARINGPGPGADFTMFYPQALSTDSPVFALVSGFVRSYLTETTGLDRYVLAGAPLSPIGGYQTALVTTASTDHPVPTAPSASECLHVLATVVAQTAQFATVNLVYPLTVENSQGTWMVAAIDLTPQVSGEGAPAPARAG